jgi:hypothetical protein
MHKMLVRCPNCGGKMEATRLSCTNCETVILARYEPCPFCRLSEESQRFVESFVRYRGNLKEMERALGESYWTLRNRLGDVIHEMGFEDAAPAAEDEEARNQRRREILDQLDRGEIDAARAAQVLAELRDAESRGR